MHFDCPRRRAMAAAYRSPAVASRRAARALAALRDVHAHLVRLRPSLGAPGRREKSWEAPKHPRPRELWRRVPGCVAALYAASRLELRALRAAQIKDAGRRATGAHKHARTRELGRKISGHTTAPEREQRTCARRVRDLAIRPRTRVWRGGLALVGGLRGQASPGRRAQRLVAPSASPRTQRGAVCRAAQPAARGRGAKRRWAVLSGALVCASVAFTHAPSAQAAGPPGALDSRAWELVSPLEKNGGEVAPVGGRSCWRPPTEAVPSPSPPKPPSAKPPGRRR